MRPEKDRWLTDGTISLRPVEPDDLELLRSWRNDPEIRSRTREYRLLGPADQAEWFRRISGPDRRDHMFVVFRSDVGDSRDAIGAVGLCYWSPVDRTAEVSFYIGDRTERRKGHARAALRLLLTWGFHDLGLAKVWAEVFDGNVAGARVLVGLGFREEGVLRQHVYRAGIRRDVVRYGLVAVLDDLSKAVIA